MVDLKAVTRKLLDERNRELIRHDLQLYTIYNGMLRDKILSTLRREFEDPKTISELQNRIVPINITKKICDALAQVYLNEPVRKPVEEDERDMELIVQYSKSWNIDTQMDFANKLFKLTKNTLLEPYLDKNGIPRLRALPSHTFTLFSNDPINPEKMTAVVKHIAFEGELEDMVFEYWDDEHHIVFDGKGRALSRRMAEMGNEDMVNPYGEIPFIHVTQQRELLTPIPSTDVLSVQMAICLLLSDATLAQKYLSWGTLVISGGDGEEKVKIGPGAIVNLPALPTGEKPDIKYVQPDLNSDEVLRLIDKLVEILLSTNNLSAGTVLGALTVDNASSGIAKMMDKLESTEDKENQEKYFVDAEKDLWDLFAHTMLPVWVESGQINPDYTGAFSPEFEIMVIFNKISPMKSESEEIQNVRLKLEAGLISTHDAIKHLNPDFDDEMVKDHINNIRKEKLEDVTFIERNMGGSEESGD